LSKLSPSDNNNIACIALDVPVENGFDFLAPQISANDIGRLAIVPFGKRKAAGIIVDIAESSNVPPGKLRSLERIVYDLPKLSALDLALFRFCSGYYHHPLGQVILNALPVQFRSSRPFRLPLVTYYQLTRAGREQDAAPIGRALTQRHILERLSGGLLADNVAIAGLSRGKIALQALLEKKCIERVAPGKGVFTAAASPLYALNTGQSDVVARIVAALGHYQPFLLTGITGSGKTEVYLAAMRQVLQKGEQVLVLVPEINLTPQLEAQFRARFPQTRMVSLHSHLARAPRTLGWLEAQSGHAQIVLGTRLAVFTPMPRLGLIVIDEEHDASYKQQEGLRYSARDVAVYRARLADCPVVLGSATPSLESYFNAEHSGKGLRYTALALTQRAIPSATLPVVRLLDMNRERLHDGLSETLLVALRTRLAKHEQSLLFINRRGYAPALVCRQCAWMPECPHCTAHLVFHKSDARLRCHHCGQQTRVPPHCAKCGSADLAPAGQGTQRIMELIAAHFPDSRIARVDRDSLRARGAAQRIFDAAHKGEIDILIGTQMLAKGHDFPKLTLVGVLNADAAMFSADFRAPERLFSQLVQVAGRAGRAGLKGEVLVQTSFPAHPLYAAVQEQDFTRFARLQLEERRLSGMPPFSHLALLRVEARAAGQALKFAGAALELGKAHAAGVALYDAVPAPLEKKGGWERAQVLVQSRSRTALQRFIGDWRPQIAAAAPRSTRWIIDVDPSEV
jgi:primosomal protein N' (replication factor Y)